MVVLPRLLALRNTPSAPALMTLFCFSRTLFLWWVLSFRASHCWIFNFWEAVLFDIFIWLRNRATAFRLSRKRCQEWSCFIFVLDSVFIVCPSEYVAIRIYVDCFLLWILIILAGISGRVGYGTFFKFRCCIVGNGMQIVLFLIWVLVLHTSLH